MRVLLRKFLISTLVLNFIILCLLISFNKSLYAADKSLSFDGSDDYVEIAANNVLNPTGDYTVAAWFKQEGENSNEVAGINNDYQSIITSRSVSGKTVHGYMMYLRSSTNALEYWKGTNDNSSFVKNETTSLSTWKANGGGDPGTPGWNYYVIRFNGSNQTDLFLDGALIKSITSELTMNLQNTSRPVRIGAGNTNSTPKYWFNGKIDDVAIWDEALTDAEISALYNSGETLYAKENYGDYSSKDNLVAYYTMDSDNGAGTTLTDDEGNNDGSFEGAPSWSNDVPGTLPTLSSSNPSDGQTDVPIDTNIVLTFSEIVRVGTGNIVLHKASDDSVVETFDVTSDVSGSESTEITINPSADLEKEVDYYVKIASTAIVDLSNNSYAGISDTTTLNFTTGTLPTNPLDDKDVVGLIEAQTEVPKKIVTGVTTPIFNRLNWIRRYSLGDELLAQKINFNFSDPKLNDFSKLISQSVATNKPEKKILDSWLFWSEGSVSIGTVDATSKSSKKDIDTNAVTLGMDKKINNQSVHGYTITYIQEDAKVGNKGTSSNIDSYSFSLYRAFNQGSNNYFEGVLGLSKLDIKNIRKSGSNTLTGSRNGKQIFGSLQAIKTFKNKQTEVSPNLRLDLGYTILDEYSEKGTNPLKYDEQTVETVGLYGGFNLSNEIFKEDYIIRPAFALELGYDLSPNSDVSLNYVSDPNTKYTKSIDQEDDKSIKGKIGFDVVNDSGPSMMFFYERVETEDSHSDTYYFTAGYVTHRKDEFALGLVDQTASASYKKTINGLDISLNSEYDVFEEYPNYEINLNAASKF